MINFKKFFAFSFYINLFFFNLYSETSTYNSFRVIFYEINNNNWKLVHQKNILLTMNKVCYDAAKIIIDDARMNNLQVSITTNALGNMLESKEEIIARIAKNNYKNPAQSYIPVSPDTIEFKRGFLMFAPKILYKGNKNKWVSIKLPKNIKNRFIRQIIEEKKKKKKMITINLTAIQNDFIYHYLKPDLIISDLDINTVGSSCELYYE
jgi:hypothetical protein